MPCELKIKIHHCPSFYFDKKINFNKVIVAIRSDVINDKKSLSLSPINITNSSITIKNVRKEIFVTSQKFGHHFPD